MKIRAVAVILAFCTALPATARSEPAQTVFVNGNIYTMNERQPRAEAIAVKGDRIVFVGSNADAKKYQSAETKTVDLAGKTVVPGLTDSHCHIFGIGEREMNLNLEGANTLEDFLARVKERVAKTERGKWVTGRGWIETFWKPPQFPTRADLDKIAPDNPVFLTRADGHAAIANSAALRIAKIDKGDAESFWRRNFARQTNRRSDRDAARSRPGPGRQKYSRADRGGTARSIRRRGKTRAVVRLVRDSKRRQ